jgi:protease-4
MIRRLVRWLIRTAMVIVVLIAIAAAFDFYSRQVRPGSFLLVRIDGPVLERSGLGFISKLRGRAETPLNVLRPAIEAAAKDSRIAGMAVEVIDPTIAFAKAQEIVGLVRAFAKSGKPVAAYLETAGEFAPGNMEYMVASAAASVSLMPQGEVNLVGLQLREMFARGTLDWLGINPQFDAIGRYKSAPNVFTEKGFTPAQREEDTALADDLFSQLVETVAQLRRLSPADVRALIDQAPFDAKAALKAKLVDRLEYEDQFVERIKHYGGTKHKLVDYADYARPPLLPSLRVVNRVAVIYGSGEIDRGAGGLDPFAERDGTMDARTMAEAFRQARKDDSIKAVVFRINSPGGSVIASELIRREVELTAHKKPVVASMSSLGASGAYWVATAANKIFAEPATLTGSIGVLAGKFNFTDMAAKLGVQTDAISRGQNVTMFDEFTNFSPEQQQLLHNVMLQRIYDEFVARVASSRKLKVEQVQQVAQGRVWTGEQARKLELVDALGGFDAALREAKSEAKLAPEEKVELVELPVQPGLLNQLLGTAQVRALWSQLLLAKMRALRPLLRMQLLGAEVSRLVRSGTTSDLY